MDPVREAVERAGAAQGLQPWYWDSVMPLVRDPEGFWPRCCGGGCEPCSLDLVAVALDALEALGTPRRAPLPR